MSAESGKTFLNHNPANVDDVVGEFQASGEADVDRAVRRPGPPIASGGWSRHPNAGEMLYRTGELLLQRKEETGPADDARDGQGAERDAGRCAGGG